MTEERFIEILETPDNGNFSHVLNKRSRRADLHAYLLLDALQPDSMRLIDGAEHDVYWFNIDVGRLAAVINEEQAIELRRCGVKYDSDVGRLAM